MTEPRNPEGYPSPIIDLDYPLGVPLVAIQDLGLNNFIPRGSIINGGGQLKWRDVGGDVVVGGYREYLIREDAPAEDEGWTRMVPMREDSNDMPPGRYVLFGRPNAFRMYNVSDRYDGPARIGIEETFFQRRPHDVPPYVYKIQANRMPTSWSAYSLQDIQSTCTLPANIRVEIYRIPFRMRTQDIDRFQTNQNIWMGSGAKLVTTLTNVENSVDVRGYPNPIISELGIPTLYLDVWGWEPGLYVDVWYNYTYDADITMQGMFEVSEMMDIPSFSEELYWIQPVIYPGGMPRDAKRFPVGVALALKAEAKIDKAFWTTRFKHIAPHITIMMRNPLTQWSDEYGNKLKPYKERYLVDVAPTGKAEGVDGLEDTSGNMNYIYFDRRLGTLWWRYFDGRWWANAKDNSWLGEYIVDLFFYVEWGLEVGCGISQPLHAVQHGFRCDWAYTRHSRPGWEEGKEFASMDIFDATRDQYNSSEIVARDSYKILQPYSGTSYKTLFSN